MEADGTSGVMDNAFVTVGGMLTQCKQKPTRSGTGLMGYAVLEGITGSVEAVLFPRTLQQVGSAFVDDAPVLVKGKLNIREDRANSLLVDEIQPLNEAGRSVYIKFDTLNDETMRQACAFLKKSPGRMPVILYDSSKRIAKGVPEAFYVDANETFLEEAERRFGEDSVKIK